MSVPFLAEICDMAKTQEYSEMDVAEGGGASYPLLLLGGGSEVALDRVPRAELKAESLRG